MGHRNSDRNPSHDVKKVAAAGKEDSSSEDESSSKSKNSKLGFVRSGSNPHGSGLNAPINGGAGPSRDAGDEDEDESSCSEEDPYEEEDGSHAEESCSSEGGSDCEEGSEEEGAMDEELEANEDDEGDEGDEGEVPVEDAQTTSEEEDSPDEGCEPEISAPRPIPVVSSRRDRGIDPDVASSGMAGASNQDAKTGFSDGQISSRARPGFEGPSGRDKGKSPAVVNPSVDLAMAISHHDELGVAAG